MLRRATEDHDRAMPLVLLPGFMTDPDLWADMAPSLAPFGPYSIALSGLPAQRTDRSRSLRNRTT